MSRHRGERGASAVEMAVIAPAFLLLIFAIVEVAQWMHAKNVVMGAAREGAADMRVVSGCADTSPIVQKAIYTASSFGSVQNPTATATCQPGKHRVTVTVRGTVVDLIPGWDLTVTGTASGLLEDFQPDLGPS